MQADVLSMSMEWGTVSSHTDHPYITNSLHLMRSFAHEVVDYGVCVVGHMEVIHQLNSKFICMWLGA